MRERERGSRIGRERKRESLSEREKEGDRVRESRRGRETSEGLIEGNVVDFNIEIKFTQNGSILKIGTGS